MKHTNTHIHRYDKTSESILRIYTQFKNLSIENIFTTSSEILIEKIMNRELSQNFNTT